MAVEPSTDIEEALKGADVLVTCTPARAPIVPLRTPPPGLFMQRSAISVISSSTLTGRAMRTSSPTRSRAETNSERSLKDMRHLANGSWPVGLPLSGRTAGL